MKTSHRAATFALLTTVVSGLAGPLSVPAAAQSTGLAAAAPGVTAADSAKTAASGQALTFTGRAPARSNLNQSARWYWLANYKPSARAGLDRKASVNLGDGSQQYGLGEKGSGDSTATWRLNGTCSRLTAYAGSGSYRKVKPDTRRRVEVLTEGKRRFAGTFLPGQGQNIDISVSKARAITVSVIHEGSYNASDYGLGNAKILCTAPPGKFDPVD